MTTPVTTLDRRYSNPNAAATEWDKTRQVLESAQVFWISTVRADGRPHVTPCTAVWPTASSTSIPESPSRRPSTSANPHVVLTTGCNHWDRGLDVVVEGDASWVADDAALTRLAEAWATRWDGGFRFVARDGTSVMSMTKTSRRSSCSP